MDAASDPDPNKAIIRKVGVTALNAHIARPVRYWQRLQQRVTAQVDRALVATEDARRPLITYLRSLEAMARLERGQGRTLKVIESRWRLLGDRRILAAADEPIPSRVQNAP